MPHCAYLEMVEGESLIDGRFSQIRRISPEGGNGYFSLLFEAIDNITNQKVALKFYDPTKYTFVDRLKRFKREAEILEKLNGEPYVISSIGGLRTITKQLVVQGSGIVVPLELQFIAMDYAEQSIEDIIYDQSLDPITLLKYFKEMMKAIHRVHKRKLCHRDIKPSNFLLSKKQVCISDFGTAKCMQGSMPDIIIDYQNPVGDLRYIAPELHFAIGIDDELVYAADMFSMGAILFEMFTLTVLTTQLFSPSTLKYIGQVYSVLTTMNKKDKIETFFGIVDDLAKKIKVPDIFAYNDHVPKSILRPLDNLFKSLVCINPRRRINDPHSTVNLRYPWAAASL